MRKFANLVELCLGGMYFFMFSIVSLAGAPSLLSVDDDKQLAVYLVLAWTLRICGWFALFDAARIWTVVINARVSRLDSNLARIRSHYFRPLEWLLALLWLFTFILSLMFAAGIAWALRPGDSGMAITAGEVVISIGLSYASFLFLLLALCYFGISEARVERVTGWRWRFSLTHAVLLSFAPMLWPNLPAILDRVM